MNLGNFLLLPDEYDVLLQKKKELHDEMDEAGKLIAEVTTQSSETYHDNAWYDEWVRIMNMLWARNKELNELLNNCKIITHKKDGKPTVGIGSMVSIKHNGKEKEFMVWGFYILPGRIAYQSALGQALLWKQVGDDIQFTVWKVLNLIEILKIN